MSAEFMRAKFQSLYLRYCKVPGIGPSAYRQIWTAFPREHLHSAMRAANPGLMDLIDFQVGGRE